MEWRWVVVVMEVKKKVSGIGVGVGVRRSDGVVWKEINKQTMRRMEYKQEQRVRTEAEIEK